MIQKTTKRGSVKRGKIGLVLSGGAARGLAHLGVLGVLEEYNIPIDLITGASIGSIIAGYLASGYSTQSLIEKMKEFNRFTEKSKKRINKYIDQQSIEELFCKDLGDINIESLRIPVSILAADITSGEMAVIENGSLAKAMVASSAFPGLIKPLLYRGHFYIDGGILNSMLLHIAHAKGADIIIFSDVSIFGIVYRNKLWNIFLKGALKFFPGIRYKPFQAHQKSTPLYLTPRILYIVKKYIKQCEWYRKTLPDIILQPNVKGIRPLDFNKLETLVELGREEALAKIQHVLNTVQ
jgi:predicted acylesterase/phospholipase RssA